MTTDTQLTIQDMTNVITIIDLCSERGAFKGQELYKVGEIRNKFLAFINENTPKKTDEPEEEEKEEA